MAVLALGGGSARIKRTPSSREEIVQADGTKKLAPLSDLAPEADGG